MCGISGALNLDFQEPLPKDLVPRMNQTLVHRGPDDEGYYISGPVGLGHRRLSIIDLDCGDQPMFSEDRHTVIVFNGEIYNYQLLRKELQKKGRRFRSHSDTEVILQAYQEFGEECVRHLRGMFSFAIWDSRARTLFLARDRIGIKPLYYFSNGRRFLFGSEMKAILQDSTVPRRINPHAMDDYLTYLYIPAPKTIFHNIYKLRPGHTLSISETGIKEKEYWDLSFEPQSGLSESDYEEGLLEKLKESVSAHLVSDVPLGAFLSGGLDSTAIVGIMTDLMKGQVSTASIGFLESGFNELPYARIAAQAFHTDSYEKTVEPDAVKILDSLVWYYDEPFADSSMVPTYYVSQVAAERVKVCLSGDGGDENFGGYRRYRFDVFENKIRSLLPYTVRAPLFGMLGSLYPKADWLPQVFRAKTLLTNLSLSPERGYFNTMSWFTPEMKRQLYTETQKRELGSYDSFSVMKEYFDHTRGWHPLSRIQYVDIKTYLPDDILTKVDRASMAHSLEVRVPLLDHEFMEFASRIPANYKLRGGEGKYIFKRATTNIVPREIRDRPKMGFCVPLSRWFREDLKKSFEEQVFSRDGFITNYFNPGPIQEWWVQHQRGTRDFSTHLWALLVLEQWGRRFLL